MRAPKGPSYPWVSRIRQIVICLILSGWAGKPSRVRAAELDPSEASLRETYSLEGFPRNFQGPSGYYDALHVKHRWEHRKTLQKAWDTQNRLWKCLIHIVNLLNIQ